MPVLPGSDPSLSLDGQGKPLWLCCELTYRCPLKCVWCSNPLDFDRYRENELDTDEWKRVLREGRALGALQLGFTGGEPAVRDDLEELVAEANGLGYYVNLITSGMHLDYDRLKALKKAGLHQIQLSIQSSDPATSNALVGARAFDTKVQCARDIKSLGFPMVLNVPVCWDSIERTEDVLKMAEDLEVDYLEYVNIQYYNWALLNRSELLPSREQLARAEEAVIATRERLGDRMTIYFVIPDYYDGRPKACMNGWGSIHFTIAPDGTALPCQEARVIKTNEYPSVRDHDLAWIWHDSPVFNKFRGDDWMKEPCRSCDEKQTDFGGCRCQAYLLTGDAAKTDPACSLSPDHGIIEAAIAEAHRPLHSRQPLVLRQAGSITTAFTESVPENAA
ncbi:MAG: pyrroloquinoline quinone biosynthesis protein PqqE [Alphaproteobacteria bacterium]|jgi:pyrroloquinoline quinone biosynthesis protein E|nr:pyrroloquinoline quinone biosynthesis protein PqqE [Alphaproteobacteria bacterium]